MRVIATGVNALCVGRGSAPTQFVALPVMLTLIVQRLWQDALCAFMASASEVQYVALHAHHPRKSAKDQDTAMNA